MKSFDKRMMMGRLANGFQGGHGSKVHACESDKVIAYGHGAAICGAKPGRKSVGWSPIEKLYAVDCPKCLKKLTQNSKGAI